jgi:ubiquinol-cytochrome c reductase cytochrome b subunit
MDTPATYLSFWFIQISVPNLLAILAMVVLFILALVVPFPGHRHAGKSLEGMAPDVPPAPNEPAAGNWTRGIRNFITTNWPWHQFLPDRQPKYLRSWVYMFGVGALAALVWIVISGLILVLFGPTWWHVNGTGRFVNSIHFWSVQLFFIALILHLWGQFAMASWRDGRGLTWVVGVATFAVAIAAAFTGYLSQQNLDAQWIALNGKDAINATGLGAFFNVLDLGQMFGVHVILLPAAVLSLVTVHIILVRLRGVVKPIGWASRRGQPTQPTPVQTPDEAQS